MQALYRAICTIDNIDKYMLYIKIINYQKSEINVMLKILMECREQEVNKSEKETTYSTYSLSVHGLFQCTVCISSRNKRNRCRCRSDSGS